MKPQEIIDYCMQKPGAYTDCPFGPEPICVRVEKRIFAEVFPVRDWVTLKCEPMQGLLWREMFEGSVRRGYHCPPIQQPYNNTVELGGTVPDDLLRMMMDHSYERAVLSLTKAARAKITHQSEQSSGR